MARAIILAAGRGTRLVSGFDFPKPLKRVGGVPLIARVIQGLYRAGVHDVVVVIGHLGDVLQAHMIRHKLRNNLWKLRLTFVVNDEYDKPNGTSLLKAADFVRGPTLLMMSDHLWSPGLLSAVRAHPLPDDGAVLGVDHDIASCFDLDDATKVKLDGTRIADIGKTLADYDCLDTGVFHITPALIEALREVDGADGCSLSEGIALLASRGTMHAVDVGDAHWIDVDTPAASAEAERLLGMYGDELRATVDQPQLGTRPGA